ncbi:SDR family oxidoreductase [Tepidibacter hydrothermalis]|uniref:SDR family oxidoreductase n=1 Tax=Tepidibacter hydrothermalis TaxID=3036126 RepID=A0ABY8ECA2_9FIRM|nr:SDR family oxidoreductase [Tepidibacter hydrothermalis]WFD09419.1 SDR family oxidoreductase [Tepidibacter hydrothermalis]
MFYSDKVVLITGSANGIGKIIAKEYCKKGATVILADIDQKNGIILEKEYKNLGFDAYFYKIDLSKSQEIIDMFKFIIDKYKKIHIIINNAGISKFKSLYELTIDEWDNIINVNLRSAFITSQEFAKYNKNTHYGRIVNIASTRHIMSEPNSEAYAASKGGIVSLTHALAISLSQENITVNCISPGWIQNNNYSELTNKDHKQHPSSRVGKPEDIARTCLFLTDEKNDFINGENIIIDGGMTKKMIYID